MRHSSWVWLISSSFDRAEYLVHRDEPIDAIAFLKANVESYAHVEFDVMGRAERDYETFAYVVQLDRRGYVPGGRGFVRFMVAGRVDNGVYVEWFLPTSMSGSYCDGIVAHPKGRT